MSHQFSPQWHLKIFGRGGCQLLGTLARVISRVSVLVRIKITKAFRGADMFDVFKAIVRGRSSGLQIL